MAGPPLGARSSCCSAIYPGRTPLGSSGGLSGMAKWPRAHAIGGRVYFLVFRGTVRSRYPADILGRHATGKSGQGREQGLLSRGASVAHSVAGEAPDRVDSWVTPARQVRGFAADRCRPVARAVDRQTAHRSLDSGGAPVDQAKCPSKHKSRVPGPTT